MTWTHAVFRALSPAVARPSPKETMRAAIGAGAGLLATGLLVAVLPHFGAAPPPFLIAPLGATAFLLFAVPNSPLAQPWSAVIGNFLSALVALAVVRIVPDPHLAAAFAVSLAVMVMMVTRAMHPPAGAVALLIALSRRADAPLPVTFALSPVMLDTALLVALAVVYNRATGRVYPFRLPPEVGTHGTRDVDPGRRLGLSGEDLGNILRKMNLAANIGPEDLARLIGVAEAEATARHLGGLTAKDIMSRDIVTALPDTHPDDLAAEFLSHGFKTLPIVDADGRYLGLLSQAALLGLHDNQIEARQIMSTLVPTVGEKTPIAQILPIMADGGQQSLPVLEGTSLRGLVTRSDVIGALAHELAVDMPSGA
jgi:CBS domain-containing membrane protein